ncbi:hypothetical protein F5Y06DRAFT_302198 [Hypoxylon sp. FL0890]|nr:hypothetical protein F5Y06DRAFT_302198 [Hypoxylon sp. FL0890]
MSSATMPELPNHLSKAQAKEYLETHRENLKEYLGARIAFFEDVGYFFNAYGHDDACLVIILTEDCPWLPDRASRNWKVEEKVLRTLTNNRPLPSEPEHTLFTMFADYVVVRKDRTAESGYAVVAWPQWVKTPAGEYGGEVAQKEEEVEVEEEKVES